MILFKVTEKQRDMILLALKNEIRGDCKTDPYDNALKRLIKKIESL